MNIKREPPGRWNGDPRRPTNVGGHRVQETRIPLSDSSLKDRKAPRCMVVLTNQAAPFVHIGPVPPAVKAAAPI